MDFKTLCTGCRTYRRFTQEKIAPEVLDELMDNVRIANSAMNGPGAPLCAGEGSGSRCQDAADDSLGRCSSEGARHAEGRRTADGFRPHLQGRPRQSVG